MIRGRKMLEVDPLLSRLLVCLYSVSCTTRIYCVWTHCERS